MFVGTYDVRLDSKHRIMVPQKIRQAGAEKGQAWTEFYFTLGAEGCVFVYTIDGWKQMLEQLGATKSLANRDMRKLQRLVAGNVVHRELDAQGRIILPEMLRTHAGLGRDVLWVGAVNRAEIWDAQRWQTYNLESASQLGETLDIVAQAGFVVPGGTEEA